MLVNDRQVVDRVSATYAPVQFGRHRAETPEGYVIWEGVRLGRTGPMLYKPEDFPGYEPGPNGWIVVERDEDVLFHPDTMASFNAKTFTNDHPPKLIDIDDDGEYSKGVGFNIRRGEGVEASYLIGDILVKDAETIAAIDKGKRDISLGYDCDAEQVKPGLARVTKIVGNHIALVQRGRAGPSCSILDEDNNMATPKKPGPLSKLRKALTRAFDEAAEEMGEEVLDEGGEDSPQRIVIEVKGAEAAPATEKTEDEGEAAADPYEARFAAMEAAITKIGEAVAKMTAAETAEANVTLGDEGGDEDEPGEGTKDEAEEGETTKTAAMDAMSKAEILAPGITMPTFDSATGPASPINALRRKALSTAYAGKYKAAITSVMGGQTPDFAKMSASTLTIVFDAASAVVAAQNNAMARPNPISAIHGAGRMTPAKLQELNEQRRNAGKAH